MKEHVIEILDEATEIVVSLRLGHGIARAHLLKLKTAIEEFNRMNHENTTVPKELASTYIEIFGGFDSSLSLYQGQEKEEITRAYAMLYDLIMAGL